MGWIVEPDRLANVDVATTNQHGFTRPTSGQSLQFYQSPDVSAEIGERRIDCSIIDWSNGLRSGGLGPTALQTVIAERAL